MMMRKLLILTAAACLLAFGCDKPDPEPTPPQPDQGSASNGAASPEPSTNGTEVDPAVENGTGDSDPEVVESPKPDPPVEPKITLANLGTEMDIALDKVGPAKVEVRAQFRLPEGSGNARPDALIQDHETFRIDYYQPKNTTGLNRVVSNKGEMVMLSEGGWAPTSHRNGKLSKEDLSNWGETFYRDVFAGLLDGREMYSPLFDYWNDPANGVTVTFDEREQLIEGRDYKFYTILAEMEGEDQRLVEIKVDSVRLLPVAIRTEWKEGDRTFFRLWSAKWAFGGEHDPKVFDLSIAK